MKSFHRRTSRPAPHPVVAVAPVVHRDGLRADQLLVERGLAPSRTVAQRLIEAGRVSWVEGVIAKASLILPLNAEFAVADDATDRYVGRGGIKLAGALAHTKLDVRGKACLDVGQSTGGFTDCLLQAGAASVTGVDVGHSQLHPKLRDDPRVTCIEGINARELQKSAVVTRHYGLIVADLSFISLTLVLPQLPTLLAEGGDMLLLVKPQFEVGPEHVGKGGIVRDVALYPQVETRLRQAAEAAGLRVLDYFDSPISGTDGNREFFIWTKP
ncbi:MAG: TlyA family RNA methyltransferase [Rhodocyclales bacterium]|nr:TlyA family RNA methyltransferase [Rhodocyclales bacterium]